MVQPIESHQFDVNGGSFPQDPNATSANFINHQNNRSYQPRAYAPDYLIPERIYQYSVSLQQELPFRPA